MRQDLLLLDLLVLPFCFYFQNYLRILSQNGLFGNGGGVVETEGIY